MNRERTVSGVKWTQIDADEDWEQIAADVERHVGAGNILKNVISADYTDYADFVVGFGSVLGLRKTLPSQNILLSKVTCPSLKAKSA
jgi:hypothetical protein